MKGFILRSHLILALLSSALLTACTQHISIVPTQVQGFAPWSNETPPHRLASGDEFDLRFLLNPELNDTKLVVGSGRPGHGAAAG